MGWQVHSSSAVGSLAATSQCSDSASTRAGVCEQRVAGQDSLGVRQQVQGH